MATRMRVVLWFLLTSLLLGGALSQGTLRHGPHLAAAHAAMELCALRYVSELPASDVYVSRVHGSVGPAARFLRVEHLPEGGVRARALWAEATAVARPELGCTLLVDASEAELRAQRVSVARPSVSRERAWPVGDAPIDHGDDAQARALAERLGPVLDAAFTEPRPERPARRMLAVLVAHRGRLIAERYAHGVSASTRLHGWSATKSLGNLLAGRLAHERGFDVHAPLASIPGQPPVTADHLLRMTSGIDYEESYAPGAIATRMLYHSASMADFVAALPRAHAPGERFLYSTGSSNLVARELQRMLGDDLTTSYQALYALAFAPLGIASAVVQPDESGGIVAGAYGYMTGRDWLRVGQLYLQDGVWNEQRLLPEGWVQYSTTPTSVAHDYGAGFWLNTGEPRERLWPALPPDVYAARGRDGQYVVVFPADELVVGRFGITAPEDSPLAGTDELLRDTLAAVRALGEPSTSRAQP